MDDVWIDGNIITGENFAPDFEPGIDSLDFGDMTGGGAPVGIDDIAGNTGDTETEGCKPIGDGWSRVITCDDT